jgi:N utilization substance protein B
MARQKQAGDKGSTLFRRRRFWARSSAVQMLYQLDMQKSWEADKELLASFDELLAADDLLSEIDPELDANDCAKARSYARQLLKGVAANHEEIDALIRAAALNWSLERMSVVDRAILRLSAYEISRVSKVTPATAINEAVELAKRFGQAESPRFINGVLDNIRRAIGKKQLAAEAKSAKPETEGAENAEAGTAEAGTAEAGTAEAGTAEAGTAEASAQS